jgi:hypothetical protein
MSNESLESNQQDTSTTGVSAVSKQWGVAGCSVAEPVMLCDELTTPVGGGGFRQDGDEMHFILPFTDSVASISRRWWYHYWSECQSSCAKSGGDQQIT